jgi:hypothetical protein
MMLRDVFRDIFHSDISQDELPAHVYVRSIRNIAVERSWLRLRLDLGDNAVLFFNKGIEDGLYNPNNPQQLCVCSLFSRYVVLMTFSELCQWLWPMLLRKELKDTIAIRNASKMRKDDNKGGPSGVSRDIAFTFPERWGGRNCLLPVDVDVIRKLKEDIGGEELLDFVSRDFAARAQTIYDTLNISDLTFQNVWAIFDRMYPLMFP